jgi:tyrosyl-tRNA synthetase
MTKLSVDEQLEIISRGTEEVIPLDELRNKIEKSIKTNTPLNIKLGCDPTRPDLHIGHAVVLKKLRDFQDLGHQAILIIGDFTAMIGDPSERNKTRPQLSLEEAKVNAKTYIEQAKVILDINNLKILYNSTWLNKMNFTDVIEMSSKYTVARMIERDDFTKRFESEIPISIHEFLYPLAQAMDSVEIKADVELGGTDQKFNLLVGRDFQREYKSDPQIIITLPLLEGLDGVEKMSKSYGNYIGLTDSPSEMFGKIMSINDTMISKYFKLALFYDSEEIENIETQLSNESTNPRDIKRQLARELIARYHSEKDALIAQEEFDQIFINKSTPEDIEHYQIGKNTLLIDILLEKKLIESKGEGKRLITQNAIKIDNEPCKDPLFDLKSIKEKEVVVKVGKRRFLKIIL